MLVSQWFAAKYYQHDVPAALREWPARGKLMEQLLTGMEPDVLCIQEGNGETVETEFGFMRGLGYEYVKYSKPFRMPMLTFWKTDRLELLREKSANRTVITVFRARVAKKTFAVVNCHLSAGDVGGAPRKRLQQVVDGLETARKELAKALEVPGKPQPKKKGAAAGSQPAGTVCVVGDFNSDVTDVHRKSVVAHFLQTGEVGPDFREDADGGSLTSKTKRHRFGGLVDAYGRAFTPGERPATYVAAPLIQKFVGRGEKGEQAGLTAELVQAVRAMHSQFADREAGMSISAIKDWSRTINGIHSAEVVARGGASKPPTNTDRGVAGDDPLKEREKELQAACSAMASEGYRGSSEYKQALSLLQSSPGGLSDGALTADGLVEVYGTLIREGKFWYAEHDVNKLGVWPQQNATSAEPEQLFEATFDYIFYSAERLQLQAVRQPLTAEQRALVYEKGDRFPCAWHMSDHLPVAASFEFVADAVSSY
jgi:endonuclease/exonuclease/phosphatase family metal-dependent hydrolase